MKPEQFVNGIWDTLVIEGLESYKDIYNNTPI
jgi:hypothetical protein